MHFTRLIALAAISHARNALTISTMVSSQDVPFEQPDDAEISCALAHRDLFFLHYPKPTDQGLVSLASAFSGTEFSVPSSLSAALCTYDGSLQSWISSDVLPYLSSCSTSTPNELYTQVWEAISYGKSVDSFCSATATAAVSRETGFTAAGVLITTNAVPRETGLTSDRVSPTTGAASRETGLMKAGVLAAAGVVAAIL